MIHVRPERPKDYAAIDEVNRLAFGEENEAQLIGKLRDASGFDPQLSLVAHSDDTVVGHILLSPVAIATLPADVPALALAPMAVLPEFQYQGIGSELMRSGLAACRRQGHKIVILIGHPGYYPRFGFRPAHKFGLQAPFEVPDEAFMALELVPGALANTSGTVRYPPAFNDM